MSFKTYGFAALLMVSVSSPALSHERAVEFPDAQDGRVILAADLHMHTVFSDGQVWPALRVEEAQRDGLEMLSITDHLEAQPKKRDVPNPDRNRSYEIAMETVKRTGDDHLLVVNGSEITRNQPVGHINAVFLEDANGLLNQQPLAAVEEANRQGAFVFLNHPNWIPHQSDGVARLSDFHMELIEDGLLHGVEVANGTLDGHSEEALDLALEHGLTILGTSDIHGLVDWTHNAGHGGHRPMSLILAEEHSIESMKAALFAGKTVAWNYDDLLGRPENVETVVRACLSLDAGAYPNGTTVLPVDVVNECPVNFTLRNTSALTFQNVSDLIRVERNSRFRIHVRTLEEIDALKLSFEVMNTQIGGRKSLAIALGADIPG